MYTKETKNFVFALHSNFNVTRIYPRVLLKKKRRSEQRQKKKKKKKKRKKRNGRKKNKKKNIVHTPIGKNDAPRFILFSYVDSRITL